MECASRNRNNIVILLPVKSLTSYPVFSGSYSYWKVPLKTVDDDVQTVPRLELSHVELISDVLNAQSPDCHVARLKISTKILGEPRDVDFRRSDSRLDDTKLQT
jgi:hypothetical protein